MTGRTRRATATSNLLKAIEQSCDVYFYNLGNLLYQQPSPVLQDGVRKFGFGQQTGIDLPGETNGSRVPDKYWKAEAGKTDEDKVWKTGDEINLAIGQGDLLVTPLQMAVAVSAIANGGTRAGCRTWACRSPTLPATIIHQFENEKRERVGHQPATSSSVDPPRACAQVTSDPAGTAYGAFKGFPISVAGKTGTAQKQPEDDYALFMGYAPADGNSDPRSSWWPSSSRAATAARSPPRWCAGCMEAYFHTESGQHHRRPGDGIAEAHGAASQSTPERPRTAPAARVLPGHLPAQHGLDPAGGHAGPGRATASSCCTRPPTPTPTSRRPSSTCGRRASGWSSASSS